MLESASKSSSDAKTQIKMSTNRDVVRVGAYNVRGLRTAGRMEEVTEIMTREKLHVFVLSETFLQRGQSVRAQSRHISIMNVPRTEGARASGGITVLVRDRIACKLVYKKIYRRTEVVVLLIGVACVAAVYCPPRAPWDGLRDALGDIHRASRGKALIIGDMNARHITWCSKSTARGRSLRKWATENGWRIHATNNPTCRNSAGTLSTIDLVLTKSGRTENMRTVEEWREPFSGSDHQPIAIDWFAKLTHLRDDNPSIPKRRRKDKKTLEFAKEWIETELPWHTEQIRAARNQRELDRAYEISLACILAPWEKFRSRKRPERWGFFWTTELQRLSQLRTNLWRRWRRRNDEDALQRYKEVNRRIKRQARANKRRIFADFLQTIDEGDQTRSIGILSRILKARKRNVLENAPSQKRIEPAAFAEFVANQHPPRVDEYRPVCQSFRVHDDWQDDLLYAVQAAPANKAVGEDEVFAEALKAVPERAAEWLRAIWQCCGIKRLVPKLWTRSSLCPLLKKEPADVAKNWRAIALLSHARKIVEKVLDRRLRASYTFHPAQCGFRTGRSVETAILRAVRALKGGCNYVCVLDFAQAYASVPRGDLVQRLRMHFEEDFANMVETLLTPTVVRTIGDSTGAQFEMRRGVPEGSPLSPALFNVVIDELAERVTEKANGEWNVPLNLFADDTVLFAPTPTAMQGLLDECTGWAAECGLEWGLRKCWALASEGADRAPLWLAGARLQYAETAEYLGMSLSAAGVTDGRTIERLCAAEAQIRQLRKAGLYKPKLGSDRIRRVYRALVQPTWSYALHVTPFSDAVERQALALLESATLWAFPKPPRMSRVRARRLLAIPDADILRWQLQLSLVSRTRAVAESATEEGSADAHMLADDAESALEVSVGARAIGDPVNEQLRRWKFVEDRVRRRRKVGPAQSIDPHALWRLPTRRHATCAANWLFGRYPERKETVRWVLGGAEYAQTDAELRATFLKTQWSVSEVGRVCHLLERFSEHWARPLEWQRLAKVARRATSRRVPSFPDCYPCGA